MTEPMEIVNTLESTACPRTASTQKSRVITAGPTHEPIDPVRYLANRSSGKMGFALAETASSLGGSVTLISGPAHLETPAGVNALTSKPRKRCWLQSKNLSTIQIFLLVLQRSVMYDPQSPPIKQVEKVDR